MSVGFYQLLHSFPAVFTAVLGKECIPSCSDFFQFYSICIVVNSVKMALRKMVMLPNFPFCCRFSLLFVHCILFFDHLVERTSMLVFKRMSFKIYDSFLELSIEYSIIIILVKSYIYLKILLLLLLLFSHFSRV